MTTSELSKTRYIVDALWRTLLHLLFAAWWGGLTFYAVFVVPIGSRQIGATEQGFITQQVTRWHNGLLAAMTVCVLIEAWRKKQRWLAVAGAGMVVVTGALLLEHARLTEMLDLAQRSTADGFYRRHAAYLWLTAVEWGLGIAVMFLIASGEKHRG